MGETRKWKSSAVSCEEPSDSGVEAQHGTLRGALHGAKRRASQRVVAALMAGRERGEEDKDFSQTKEHGASVEKVADEGGVEVDVESACCDL